MTYSVIRDGQPTTFMPVNNFTFFAFLHSPVYFRVGNHDPKKLEKSKFFWRKNAWRTEVESILGANLFGSSVNMSEQNPKDKKVSASDLWRK